MKKYRSIPWIKRMKREATRTRRAFYKRTQPTFVQWLRRQHRTLIYKALGAKRGKMFCEGNPEAMDFRGGLIVNLKELRKALKARKV